DLKDLGPTPRNSRFAVVGYEYGTTIPPERTLRRASSRRRRGDPGRDRSDDSLRYFRSDVGNPDSNAGLGATAHRRQLGLLNDDVRHRLPFHALSISTRTPATTLPGGGTRTGAAPWLRRRPRSGSGRTSSAAS